MVPTGVRVYLQRENRLFLSTILTLENRSLKRRKARWNRAFRGQYLFYCRLMTDSLVYGLVDKKLVTEQVVLTIGYDIENLRDSKIAKQYHGEVTSDHYASPLGK